MRDLIVAYIFVVLSVASLLMAWFYTEFPMLVYEILRIIGYKRHSKLWESLPRYTDDEYTKDMWEIAVALHEPKLLATLLSCRYCLSFHLAFWASLVVYLVAMLVNTDINVLFIPFCVFTVPSVSNILFKLSNDREQRAN